ncbi:hypothetical protein VTK56DRAFT_997 [Thermocarpiscus australiensis]
MYAYLLAVYYNLCPIADIIVPGPPSPKGRVVSQAARYRLTETRFADVDARWRRRALIRAFVDNPRGPEYTRIAPLRCYAGPNPSLLPPAFVDRRGSLQNTCPERRRVDIYPSTASHRDFNGNMTSQCSCPTCLSTRAGKAISRFHGCRLRSACIPRKYTRANLSLDSASCSKVPAQPSQRQKYACRP